MKYSVIVPIYNVEKYLDRCIDSIVNQNYTDYELILVDDGSPDNCPVMCDEWAKKDSRITVIHKENGGLSSARNAGLDIAKGDFVLFIDSDDYISSNYFDEIEKHAEKNSLTVFTYIQEQLKKTYKREIRNLDDSHSMFEKTKYLISSRTVNSACSKIFDRALIEKYNMRFGKKFVPAEDFAFGVKYLLLCEKVTVINTAIYVYDQRDFNSLSRGRKKNLINIYPAVFDAVYDDIINSKFSEKEKNELLLVWDKLHVDSFGTCVMEEIKDKSLSRKDVLKEIGILCDKFYADYKGGYGYSDIVHFIMRLCIKHSLRVALYILGNLYIKIRG